MTNTTNIFELATKNKFRFPYKGMISVEDLWDLNRTQLDSIYKTLNKEVKQVQEESLMMTKSDEDAEVLAKIEIVKHIFKVKEQEAMAKMVAAENAEKKRHILDILARKQDDALQNMSEDELRKMLDNL